MSTSTEVMQSANPVTVVTACRACGTGLPSETVFSLRDMPVVNFPKVAVAPQLVAPVELVKCPSCTLVQLRHTVDPDRMFRTYFYRSGISKTMREALADVAVAAQRMARIKPGEVVCDVGSNDGTLLSFYPTNLLRIGFEPSDAAKLGLIGKLGIVRDYFHRYQGAEGTFKVITACAMFYAVNDPGRFLEDVKWSLAPGGLLIVQMNDLASMLNGLAIDNIEHEHVAYYSARAFCRLCEAHFMTVTDIEHNDVNGGSLRFYVRYGKNLKSKAFHAEENEALSVTDLAWRNFTSELAKVRNTLRNCIIAAQGAGKQIGVCGASTRGLTLLHYLHLGGGTFCCAGDRDPAKVGRFYGATGIPIVDEEAMRMRAHTLLVAPYHFSKEIIQREREFLERGGELIIPLPKPKVITKEGERYL